MWNTAALFLVVGVYTAALCSGCPCETDSIRAGLEILFNRTNGQRWRNQSQWLSSAPVCEWHGVVCNNNELEIDLESNGLTGTLPPEIGALFAVNITTFRVRSNLITGGLPSEYALWTRLKDFSVAFKRFTGQLPAGYAAWTQLEYFLVDSNYIEGAFPAEYGAWSLLKEIDTQQNLLTGHIPAAALRNWTAMQQLDFSDNMFTGSFPEGLHWPNIVELELDTNRLSGVLPVADMIRWTKLKVLDVRNNNLSGSLLNELNGSWPMLNRFSIGNNSFAGTLPEFLAQWSQLEQFRVNHNHFTGTLPAAYAQWHSLCVFDAADNDFEGTLPSNYSQWNCVNEIVFTSAEFSVTRNRITGTLPPEYASWRRLAFLQLAHNKISGVLPPEYGSLTFLVSLVAMNNSLSGGIPRRYSDLKLLRAFALNNNRLSGTVPLLYVSSLLLLHDNRGLHGALPPTLGLTLVVSTCQTSLCGPLPQLWLVTLFVCGFVPDRLDFETLAKLPVVNGTLPSCNAVATTPSPLRRAMSLSLPTQVESAVAVALLAAAYRSSASLQVSAKTSLISRRVSVCNSAGGSDDSAALAEIGTAVVDNPTRLQLSDRLPYTTGTVVGNSVLLLGVPLLLPLVVAALVKLGLMLRVGTKDLHMRVLASAFLSIAGALQVPTTAAVVVLLLHSQSSFSEDTKTFAIPGSVGLLVFLLPAAVAGITWFRCRSVDGCVVARRGRDRRNGWWKFLWVTMTSERSVWRVAKDKPTSVESSVRHLVPRLFVIFSRQLLTGLHFPYRWVMVGDQLAVLLQGVLIGIATSNDVGCTEVRGAAWTLFAVCAAVAAVAVVLRPRATHADCLFEVVMSVWTACAALLAALGIEDDDGASAIAQSIVQILWCLPRVPWRIWIAVNANSGRTYDHTSADTSISAGRGVPSRRPGVVAAASSEQSTAALQALNTLEKLVRHICENTRRDSLPSRTAEVVHKHGALTVGSKVDQKHQSTWSY